MQVCKLAQFSFGMPKIDSESRKYLSANLTSEDKSNLAYIERVHPDAKLTISDSGAESKNPVKRTVHSITRALGLGEPRFKINIHEIVPDPNNKLAAISVNRAVIKNRDSNCGHIYVDTTYPVNKDNVSVDDLVKATDKFCRDYTDTMVFVNKE